MAYLQVEPGFIRHLQLHGLCNFQDFFFYAGGEAVGEHRSRSAVRVNLGGLHGYLKREYRVRWKDRLTSWWAGFGFVSKSRREWQILEMLRACGIDCPQPLAVGEDRGRAFLLVRELPGVANLCTYLRHDCSATPIERGRLVRLLAREVARFHAAGFTHPDLYAKHIFMDMQSQAVRLIDFQRTRARGWVSWRERWRDLAALDASLNEHLASPRERLLFLVAYLKATSASDLRRLFRRSLWAIARRTSHLLERRKIREMRKEPAPADRVEAYRVTLYLDGVPPTSAEPPSRPEDGLHGTPPTSRLPSS